MRSWVWTANLSNSIVGVSVLAMPFCIQQCGLVLGLLLLLFSSTLTKWSCGLLIRAAQISRRSSYEALALSTFGPLGKSIVEVSIIGLQLGTCIAFYVIIGDLAPPTIARITGLSWSPFALRAVILCVAAVLIVLPLGMLRDFANLSTISVVSLSFYICFMLYLLCLALSNIFSSNLWPHLSLWNINGVFKCLPIFSLAFSCHTQLLIIYDAHPDPTLNKMNSIISDAVNLTGLLYGSVALGGYLTFCIDHVEGDVLSNFYPSLISQFMKLCFALSVVVSFPMMIFPCRVSINSLISQMPRAPIEAPVHIPQSKFIPITIFITFVTLTVAILLPEIEMVLALTGATAGSLISFIYPATIFLSVTHSRDEHRNTAKAIMGIGLVILMASTVSILVSNMDDTGDKRNAVGYPWPQPKTADSFPALKNLMPIDVDEPVNALENVGGADDKGGGAGDSHVEHYPDHPVVEEASERVQSNPTAASELTSDATQETINKIEHKELMSKLETLEERVLRLESENQELKVESENRAVQQQAEEKATSDLTKTAAPESKTVQDGAKVSNDDLKLAPNVVPNVDDVVPSKDSLVTTETAGHDQESSQHSQVSVEPQAMQHQQQFVQDKFKAAVKDDQLDSLKNELPNVVNDDQPPIQVEHHKLPNPIGNDITHKYIPPPPPIGDIDQKVELESKSEDIKHQQDDLADINRLLLEKPAVKLDTDLPKVESINSLAEKIDQEVPTDQKLLNNLPIDQTKRSIDESIQKLEQEVPKLDTAGDVGILSRDLLHSNEEENGKPKASKLNTPSDTLQLKSEVGGAQTAATSNDTTSDSETTNLSKRSMLSLDSVNKSHSLSNG